MKRIFLFLFVLLNFSIYANELKNPSIVERFIISKEDGTLFEEENLSGNEIITCGLLFGTCDSKSESWTNSLSKYNETLAALNEYKDLPQIELGEKILETMYLKVLKQYVSKQTKLDHMFETGEYNCVSATLLYLALATDLSLDARVQETPSHAFITLYLDDGKKVDVETTNPYGFNPGSKKTVKEDPDGSKMYAVVPKSYYSSKKEVSKRKAVSIVGKNLCSSMNDAKDYENAIPLAAAIISFVTVEKKAVRDDFDTLCENYAVEAYEQKQSAQALDFLEQVFIRYGATPRLINKYSDITYNQVVNTLNNDSYKEAQRLLALRDTNLNEKTHFSLHKMTYQTEMIDICQNFPNYNQGIQFIQYHKNSNSPYNDKAFIKQLEKIEESYWVYKINNYAKDNDNYIQIAKLCDEGLVSLPHSSALASLKRQSLNNHGIKIHNIVVPFVNDKNYIRALEIVEAGLKDNPSNAILKDDEKKLKKILGQ